MTIRVLPETCEKIKRYASMAGVSYGGYIDHAVERIQPPQSTLEKRLKNSFDS